MPEGYFLRAFDVLDSSNTECHRRVEAGENGPLWVVTDQQSAGRGRRGRQWVSKKGNLFASLLYPISCDVMTASGLSFVAALAIQEMLADVLQSKERVKCKWPNDILVDGKKISGILLESAALGGGAPGFVIIGIGINIEYHPDETLYSATNIREALHGGLCSREYIFANLASSMAHWIDKWHTQGFEHIINVWKERAMGLGEEIIVRLPNEEISGKFIDLDATGALILDADGERRHISAGDVFFGEKFGKKFGEK